MRKPDFCGNRAADQRICFRYMECAISLLPKPLATYCGCPAWFASDLVGNPEDRVSRDTPHLKSETCQEMKHNSCKYLALLPLSTVPSI